MQSQVASLTFKSGKMTAGRRSAGVPQLSCTGGNACSSSYLVDVVQCHNTGEDDSGETQWKCEADLEDNVKLGDITVSCEGYSSRSDRLKLRGSCGLEYSLHYTSKGRGRSSSGRYSSGSGYSGGSRHSYSSHSSRDYSSSDDGDWVSTLSESPSPSPSPSPSSRPSLLHALQTPFYPPSPPPHTNRFSRCDVSTSPM